MKPRIKSGLDTLKHLPGVYIMHNVDNEIIYIGKAKDLYKRVSQYFLHPQVGKVAKMAYEAEYFETIITNNEKEALVLEMNLIQTHYPKYNILLKDDRHYPYIALSKNNEPILTIKRNKKDKNYIYYGPYPSANSAYTMIDLLNQLFPIRKCKNKPKEVCLYYHLNQCLGNCVFEVDENINEQLRSEVTKFLNGNNLDKYNEIKSKMLKASDEENYELALSYKKILTAIDHINEKQLVELDDKHSIDVFAFSIRENFFSLSLLLYRDGRLLAKENHILELFLEADEFYENLISQYYMKHELPHSVVVSLNETKKNLEGVLDAKVICPTRGKIYELIQNAKINADNGLDEFFMSPKKNEDKIKLLEELGTILNIKDTLLNIDENINVFGLFKDDKHTTKGVIDVNGKIYEIKNKNILFLLTRMQDEVHRFAITFHKEKRNKKMTLSYLDGIKGIGLKKKELIKKSYPTLEKLLAADKNELAQLIGEKLALMLLNNIKNN